MQRLETRVPPPILMLLVAGLMWAALPWMPDIRIGPTFGLVGAALSFLLAGVFGFPAIRAFRRAGTTINPVQIDKASVLVTAGVYGWTRNPMYVSLGMLLMCWAFLLGNATAFAGPAVFVLWINRFQIVPEERVMTDLFGASYADYRLQVRRWL